MRGALVEGPFSERSPDRIRTGATALRGRRARPLHNGAVHRSTAAAKGAFGSAGVPGLEPRLTEPESVGLPITPYPKGARNRSSRPAEDTQPARVHPIAVADTSVAKSTSEVTTATPSAAGSVTPCGGYPAPRIRTRTVQPHAAQSGVAGPHGIPGVAVADMPGPLRRGAERRADGLKTRRSGLAAPTSSVPRTTTKTSISPTAVSLRRVRSPGTLENAASGRPPQRREGWADIGVHPPGGLEPLLVAGEPDVGRPRRRAAPR